MKRRLGSSSREMQSFLSFRSADLGIDLGTANTLIFEKKVGLLVDEPSVVVVDTKTKQIEAVGAEAWKMVGRTPFNRESVYPLKNGVIADLDLTSEMLKYFLRKVRTGVKILGSRIVICVPTETTQVERKAVKEAALALRAREVYIVEEPVAAALGAGLPICEPRGSMIVDIGGGTTEIAVLSLGDIVNKGSVRMGGHHMDEAIIQFIRRKYNVLIGQPTAEKVKMEIGCAEDPPEKTNAEVKGKDLIRQMPKVLSVNALEVHEALSRVVSSVVRSIRTVLERTPPEVCVDIVESGIALTGGGALLKGFDQRIERDTGIRTQLVEDPLLSVVRGTAMLLQQDYLLERVCLKGV